MQWDLIRLRKENKMNQKDMASLLEIDVDSYGNKERGDTQFKQNEMFIIAYYFEKPMEEIFLPPNFGNTEIMKKA